MTDREHELFTEAVRRIAEGYSKKYGSDLHCMHSFASADCASTSHLLFMMAYHAVATVDGFHAPFVCAQALYLSRSMRASLGITSESLLSDENCRANIKFPSGLRLDSIYSEFDIEQYRADFVVTRIEHDIDEDREHVINVYHPLVVDCGGHEHYRTSEQVRDDKQRDRIFEMKGFRICRFKESDLLAKPFICANQVFEFIGSPENLARRIPLKLPPGDVSPAST